MSVTWCFRLRFILGATTKLSFDGSEWLVADAPHRVSMRPADGAATLGQARHLVLHGAGYRDSADAARDGVQWRDRLTLAFANLNAAADFGDRAPQSSLVDGAPAPVGATEDVQVLNDVHGLLTYREHPPARFVHAGIGGISVSWPHERLQAELQAALDRPPLTQAQRLAYDLYAASTSERSPDARFMMLMMALETLIEPRQRSHAALDMVENWLQQVLTNELEDAERDSLAGSLRHLRSESISSAGRRLTQLLGDATYQNESAKQFFGRCYQLRSQLVHGVVPRPSRDEIGERAANLEHFVSQLIVAFKETPP